MWGAQSVSKHAYSAFHLYIAVASTFLLLHAWLLWHLKRITTKNASFHADDHAQAVQQVLFLLDAHNYLPFKVILERMFAITYQVDVPNIVFYLRARD